MATKRVLSRIDFGTGNWKTLAAIAESLAREGRAVVDTRRVFKVQLSERLGPWEDSRWGVDRTDPEYGVLYTWPDVCKAFAYARANFPSDRFPDVRYRIHAVAEKRRG